MGQFGSLQLEYHAVGFRALYAAVMIHRMSKPMAFHVDAFGSAVDLADGSREGIWWLPTKNSTDSLIITNRAAEEVKARLRVSGASGSGFDVPITLPAFGSTRLSVKTLLASRGIADEYGGVELHAAKNAGYLGTVHYVVDEQTHFSALLKMFRYSEQATMATRGWAKNNVWVTRAPMLALTTPDPELRLPTGAKLHPKLFVRNVTSNPVAIGVTFNWRNDQSHGTVAGPSLTLAPLSTRLIDVTQLQANGIIPQSATWASVAISAGSKPGEIMAIATSFSDVAAYGAQTPFNDQLAFHWAGGMFLVDALHNSLTTVGNGGTGPATAQFLLWADQSAPDETPIPYELQQLLQPGEHMWVDIGDLIRRRVPDIHGRTLPVTMTSGTYEFLDMTDRAHGNLFEGKVITDKTNGHATYGCMECCGYNSAYVDPFGLNLGSSLVMPIEGQSSCTGFTPVEIVELFSYFNSDTTSVVSFPNYQNGNAYAAGVGTANLYAIAFNVEEDLDGADEDSCPTDDLDAGGPADVAKLTCTSVTRGQTSTCTANGPSGTTFGSWSFSDGTNTVSSPNGSTLTTWAGPAVISGTVSVTAATFPDGGVMQASGTLTVSPRSGWSFSAQPSTRVSSIDPSNCNNVPYIPTTPDNSHYDGAACPSVKIGEGGSFSAGQVSGGPNSGYQFVQSMPSDGGSFTWTISSDIDNPLSEFYIAQCGNYNSQTQTGFISGGTLDADTQRHEGGSVTSHYADYVIAIGMPSYNLGTQLEATIAAPGGKINNAVTSTVNVVQSAVTSYGGEPCGTHDTNRSAACVIDGFINFYPYVSCN